jgi:uncharacterized protein YjgD (DUF1641 family)
MTTENARLSRRKREQYLNQEQRDFHRFCNQRFSELLTTLDKRGLLEAAKGALEDEQTFSELMRFFSSDEALSIIQNAKSVVKLLASIDYTSLNELVVMVKNEKQSAAGFKSLLRLVNALESRGLIEPLIGTLNDEETFANITKLLSSDSSLLIISSLQNLTKLSNALDPDLLDVANKAIGVLKQEVKPVKGMWAVLRELGDPAVAAGLGRVFEMLKVVGGRTSTEK